MATKRSPPAVFSPASFWPAVFLVALILATGPAIRILQQWVFQTFPSSVVRGMTAGFATIAAALLLYAIWSIRSHRLLRYGGLLLTAGLVVGMATGFRQGQILVDLVERVHILEYGLLAFLLYRAFRHRGSELRTDLSQLLLPLLWTLTAGTLDEWWQWFVPQRTGEVRDVWINASAGVCGLLFGLCLRPPERLDLRGTLQGWREISRTAALAALTLGLFFSCAHLGYGIQDPEIGRFRSWSTAEQLAEQSAERRVEWALDPPVKLGYYTREDYFLTEAAWHVSHRNASLEHGDFYLAWQANLILEKYYSPFLDIVGFGGSGAHRWPPELRREVRKKAGRHDPKGYVSPVFQDRIFTEPSKTIFFTVLVLVVAALWVLPHKPKGPISR